MSQQPYTSPPGHHRHLCPACAVVWEHSDACFGDRAKHRCPECGALIVTRYCGDEEPDYRQPEPVNDGGVF